MSSYLLYREQSLARPLDAVFAFFANAENLEAITPPWLNFQIATPPPIKMGIGARIEYHIHWHRIRLSWLSEIVEWDPPHQFTDLQLQGPYAMWRHTHAFYPEQGGTRIVDTVHYRLPCRFLGTVAHRLKVRGDLEAIFDYREDRIREILEGSSLVEAEQSALAGKWLPSPRGEHQIQT